MTELTLKKLAAEIQTSVDHLAKQFTKEEFPKHADNPEIVEEKKVSLTHPNHESNFFPDKLTLQRKTRSTLNISSSDGKNKSIQIEIRRKQIVTKSPLREEESALKEQLSHNIEINKKRIKLKNECKGIRKTEHELTKKDAAQNLRESEISKRNKTLRFLREKKSSEVKIKAKETICRTNKKSENAWNNAVNSIKNYNYRTYTHQNDDDHEHEKIESSYAHELKEKQKKKESKHLGFKMSRGESRVTLHENKSEKCKNSSSLQQIFKKPAQTVSREVIIGETITVGELAVKMAVKSSQVIKTMMKFGALVTINHILDQETAQLITEEMGHKVILRCEDELEKTVMNDRDTTGAATKPRAPVVTIMGHVDHGKTSLLDCIRSTKVALGEEGGITQHIGTYRVETENGVITFLDTPGHAAFTAMRARGAKTTDIVVLVVAADDGVMPQTIEAIQHAKAAKVPIVVAINKIDKLGADSDHIKNELAKHGIIPEEWGGDCQFVNVSAKTGTGINELLNAILLQSEILELKAIHEGMASGAVIESYLDKGRGPVATVLIREGTLKKGDVVLCGFKHGRVRAMRNELGQEVVEAGPSTPVEIFGLSGVPTAGDKVTVVRDEKKAREVALYRQNKFRELKLAHQQKSKLEKIFSNITKDVIREINIVLKADVQGSVEAISDVLLNLSTEQIKIKIIGSGVGGITETDAILASASNAILIGFNVRADSSARHVVESEDLDFRCYSIIYNLIDEMKATISGLLSPKEKQKIIGLAEVRGVFKLPKFGVIAGCMVIEGVVKRSNPIRILRNGMVVYEGELESLRRFKEDVHEVRNGMECGIGIKNYNDICANDIIEVFEIVKAKEKSINFQSNN